MSYDPRSWLVEGVPQPSRKRKKGRANLFRPVMVLLGLGIAGATAAGVMLFIRQISVPPAAQHAKRAQVSPQPRAIRAAADIESQRILAVGPTTDLAAVLVHAAVPQRDAAAFAIAAQPQLAGGATLLTLDLISDSNGRAEHIRRATLSRPDGSAVVLTPAAEGFSTNAAGVTLQTRMRVLHGQMDGESFYTSAVAAGIDDRLIPQITEALAFDFDFAREIHAGDVFEVAYAESVNAQGRAVGGKELLYISLVTASKQVALYRFRPAGVTSPEWFTGEGRSARRSLMRTPVEGARVTSGFGMRFHPILGYTRMHKGVDFGVPVGTPVFASGDGTVAAIGPRHGFGFYLRIEHTPVLATAYGHLSGYPRNIAVGSHVRQGEVVAYSGNTGESTGPHLHYEVLVHGEQVNPLTFTLAESTSLAGPALVAFRKERDRVDRLRRNTM